MLAKAKYAARASQFLLIALILFYCSEAVATISSGGNVRNSLIKALVQVLPLVIFVSGLFKQKTHSAIYLSLVLLVYLMGAIVSAFANSSDGYVSLVLIGSLHITLIFFMHWKYKHNKLTNIDININENERPTHEEL